MRYTLVTLLVALALVSCRRGRLVEVDTAVAAELPREFAAEQIKTVLPSAKFFICFSPAARLPSNVMKSWTVGEEEATIPIGSNQSVSIRYADVARTMVVAGRGYHVVKIFSNELGGRELFQLWWSEAQPAQDFVQALEALRKKE